MSRPLIIDPAILARAQRDYVAALPRIEAHARTRFGYLRDPGRRDDAIANVIGIGWKHWLAAIAHGKNPNEFISVIADYAVRQVRTGRKVTGQEKAGEVMSPWTQNREGFSVGQLPDTRRSHESINASPHGQRTMNVMETCLIDNTVTPPPDQAAFRTDIPEWLAKLTAKKRGIVTDLMQGDTTKEASRKHGVSAGRVSQIRQEAYEDLGEYVGEGRRR